MLVPLTRSKFEQVIPLAATGAQYRYYWGKFPDFLKRLLISIVALVAVFFLVRPILGDTWGAFLIVIEIPAVLYWLWAPVMWAALRNYNTRKYPYSGFWRGEVLDVYVSEEMIGQEETVNRKGELVIVENRERRLNVEVGDEMGFFTSIQVPLKRSHKGIAAGQIAEMLVLSYEPDLNTIVMNTDIFIPSRNIWVSDYPYVQRDAFAEVSRQLKRYAQEPRRSRKRRSAPEPEADWEEEEEQQRPRKRRSVPDPEPDWEDEEF